MTLNRYAHLSPQAMLEAVNVVGNVVGRRSATFERIASKLPQVEFDALRSAKASMPAWMLEALRRYEEGKVAHG